MPASERPARLELLVNDTEWRNTLNQSFRSTFVPVTQIFALFLAYCKPFDLVALWYENFGSLVSHNVARAH